MWVGLGGKETGKETVNPTVNRLSKTIKLVYFIPGTWLSRNFFKNPPKLIIHSKYC